MPGKGLTEGKGALNRNTNARYWTKRFAVVIALVVMVCAARFAPKRADSGNWLVTPEETVQLGRQAASPVLSLEPSGSRSFLSMTNQAGPKIRVLAPTDSSVTSPVNIHVQFQPKASPVDMNSIRVHAQKWILGSYRGNLDISSRLRPFLTNDGLDAEKQAIPPGRYRFVFDIKDNSGALTEGAILLEVRG
jgi:hypothetical protein